MKLNEVYTGAGELILYFNYELPDLVPTIKERFTNC